MKSKKIIFISILVFMMVLSIGAISAEDADDAIASGDDDVALADSEPDVSGTVSGGVDVVTENPWTSTGGSPAHGELNYNIPDNAKTIKSADVYVNVYGGSASNTWGADANITIKTANGNKTYNESLWTNDGSADGTVYTVNDHITKCFSDYMIHYDITSLLTGLNGTALTIKVDTFNMTKMNKTFDGRIKLIALVLAYDDGDEDAIGYWINANQLWSKTNVTLNFKTKGNAGVSTLTNVVLSSTDGSYRINDKILGDPKNHTSGGYYQYNQWDVTKNMDNDKDTSLMVLNNGASVKNVLSVLTINNIQTTMAIATEYTNVPSAFAGTNNTLKVTVSSSKSGKYTVRLLADGIVVDEIKTDLTDASKVLFLTDPTIRAVDNTTVNGADNKKVNYTIELVYDGLTVNSTELSLPIVYNGYLGKDLAYPASGMESLEKIIINGDIVVDVKDAYLSDADKLNKTDVWTINLGEDSTIVKSFVYVPYTWCTIVETSDMFNVTFNGEKITPLAFYRDQGNLGGASGKYGYGVFVYDVTSLVNKSGDNTLFVSKKDTYPGVYSSAFVYMYNVTSSNYIKEVYINHGADLLNNNYNNANRTVKADSTFNVNSKVVSNATLYVFASNAQNNYTNLVFNGETYTNIFQAASYHTVYKQLDVTGKIKDKNSVSVVATKGTFLALHQIMVLTKNLDDVEITLAPEYTSVPSAYAGTNNLITITIEALKEGKFNATLLANGVEVNKTVIDLKVGTNTLKLIDPTIRDVNASTLNGAANDKVNYTLQLSNGKSGEIIIPILYNGYLGKDLAYPAGGYEAFLNITVNGDIVIDVKDVSTNMGSGVMNRTDVWNVNLDAKSSIVKSYIYVPYNWFNPTSGIAEDLNMLNTTFNGVKVTPIALYRDQGNLGKYGKYGYGVLVYDVTNLTKVGDNSFVINKFVKTPSVYPSVFIYMYNTTGSTVIKNIYISNGADMLSATTNNLVGRIPKSDSTLNVASISDTATLYVFASNAMSKYGDLVFNGETYTNIWSGASYATQVYSLDITNSIKNSNNVSFVSTGGTILALQQIIVTTQKAPTEITAPAVTAVYNTNNDLIVTLKEINGIALANADISIVFNGKTQNVKTDANGQFKLAIPSNLVPKTYDISISFAGDDTHIKSSLNTKVVVKKASVKLTAKKKTFKAKVKTKKYTVTLKDNKNKVMKKVKLTLKVKGKTYKATTNAKGKATFKIKNLKKKGKYTAKVTYKGDKYFNKVVKSVKITVKK